MSFIDRIKKEIEELKKRNLYRERTILKEGTIDFSSNDYLGLKNCKRTKEKLCREIEKLSLGSGASALVSGYTEIQNKLENYLSKFKQTEACIIVGSGYMANVGLLQSIVKKQDTVLSDELNHASIIDGIRLTKAEKLIYKHSDTNDLEEKIKNRKNKGQIFIVTDGVFSMEGDIAKLDVIYKIAQKYDAILIIDDAHSTGILGEGRGTLFHYGLRPEKNIIQMGTLSKAIGSYGAFICGSKLLIDYLVNKMRTVIFTTALSPIQNFISLENLKVIEKEPERREYVIEKAKYIADKLKEIGYDIDFKGTPIIPLIVGREETALKLKEFLLKRGIFIQAIRPPTVPEGTSRLRLTVSYNHREEEIEKLIFSLKEAYNKFF